MLIYQKMASFILLIGLVGCSQKASETSSARIVSSFAISSTNLEIMLYGTEIASKKTFSSSIQNEKVFVLPNGAWEFKILAWQGNSERLSGANQCGSASKVLAGGAETVDISVNAANCNSPQFTDSAFINNASFQTITIHSCDSLSDLTDYNSSCDSGLGLSFKISLMEESLISKDSLTSVDSDCYQSPFVTGVRLPVNPMYPYPIKIRSFNSLNCTPGLQDREFFFPKGIRNITNQTMVYDDETSHTTKLFLLDGISPPVALPTLPGPTQLAITGPVSGVAGVCEGPFRVTTKNAANAELAVLTDTDITINGGSSILFSSNACGPSGVTNLSLTIPTGASYLEFWARSDQAAAFNLSASEVTNGLSDDNYPYTIDPAIASQMIFTLTPPQVQAGASFNIEIQTSDAFGNLISPYNNIALTDYDSACLNPLNTITGTLSATSFMGIAQFPNLTSNIVGPKTLKAITSGLPDTCSPVFTIDPVLTITGTSPIATNSCVAYMINTTDIYNNPIIMPNSLTLNLTMNAGDGDFYSDITCTTVTNSIIIASGNNSGAFYFSNPSSNQTVTVTAQDSMNSLVNANISITTNP